MQRFRLVVRGRAAAAAAAVARRQGGQRRNGEEYDASRLRYPHVGSPFSLPAASARSPLSTRRERTPSFRWWTASLFSLSGPVFIPARGRTAADDGHAIRRPGAVASHP